MSLVRPDHLPTRTEFALPHGLTISGILEFKAGTRPSLEGVSRHDEDEVSIILSARMKAVSGNLEAELQAGDIRFIPLPESWAIVLEGAHGLVTRAQQ